MVHVLSVVGAFLSQEQIFLMYLKVSVINVENAWTDDYRLWRSFWSPLWKPIYVEMKQKFREKQTSNTRKV